MGVREGRKNETERERRRKCMGTLEWFRTDIMLAKAYAFNGKAAVVAIIIKLFS